MMLPRPRKPKLTAAITALALTVGCDTVAISPDQDPGADGGADGLPPGGEPDATPDAASDAAPPMERAVCEALDVLEAKADFTMAVTPEADQVDSTNCSEYVSGDNDVVIAFTAPSAGRWLFWARGYHLWSLTAYRGCPDEGDEPLACAALRNHHGDDPFSAPKRVRVDLREGETIHLVADGCGSELSRCEWTIGAVSAAVEGEPCTLSRHQAPDEDPTNGCDAGLDCVPRGETGVCAPIAEPRFVREADARAHVHNGSTNVTFYYEREAGPLVKVLVEWLDEQGNVMVPNEAGVRAYPLRRCYLEPGTDCKIVEAPSVVGARAVRLTLLARGDDDFDSDPIDVPITRNPRHGDAGPCDPGGFGPLCREGLSCIADNPHDRRAGDLHCQRAERPRFLAVQAYVAEGSDLTVEVEATDPNNDSFSFSVEQLDREGDVLSGFRGRLVLEGDGVLTGQASAPASPDVRNVRVQIVDREELASEVITLEPSR